MKLPTVLRAMDDRVLGDRLGRRRPAAGDGTGADGPQPAGTTGRTPGRTTDRRTGRGPELPRSGSGARQALSVVYRVSRLVLLALAAVVALGVVFVLAPTNADNVLVRTVLDLARDAAGPFRDVFTVPDDAERETVVNYAFACLAYLVAAALVSRLPGGKTR